MTDVSAFNFIRPGGLKHRQLKAFLDEIEGKYGDSVRSYGFASLNCHN
jgi:hypothetical protein